MQTTSPHGLFIPPLPLSVASQVDGACEGLATGCSCVFFGKWCRAGASFSWRDWPRGRGRASELSEASPQPVGSATLGRFYPKFLQHPPRPSHFSSIQIFYVFSQFSINSLMLVKSQHWRGKGGQSPARALTTTIPREETGGERDNGWAAHLRFPLSAEVPNQQRSLSSQGCPPVTSGPFPQLISFPAVFVTPSHSPFSQPPDFSSSLWM